MKIEQNFKNLIELKDNETSNRRRKIESLPTQKK